MSSPIPTLSRELAEIWQVLQREVSILNCELRPKRFADAIILKADGDRVRCEFKPLCMRVKEKAAARITKLYIAIEGRVDFATVGGEQRAITFASSAAYFRESPKGDELEHVYAMHYDHVPTDEGRVDFGHPTYHCQTKAMDAKRSIVNDAYHTRFAQISADMNWMRGLLTNVRMPTAYMDPFCVILQVLGDHVVNDASAASHKKRFQRSKAAVRKIRSTIEAASMLEDVVAAKCFRGAHWYPDVT